MRRPSNRAVRLDAQRCVAARARMGASRERLADESRGGLSVATIKRIEAGVPVYFDTARRFASLLDIPVAELISGPPEGVPEPDEGRGDPSTIAILPFDVADPDPNAAFFADGFVDDLMTRMRRQWFPVISRGSTFRYRGGAVDPRSLRSELGVDYLVEGSARRSGDHVRVTVRLVDTATSKQLWAEAYDRPYRDIFVVQTSLVCAVLQQITGVLLEAEIRQRADRDPSDLSAWEQALRGQWAFQQRTKEATFEARTFFESAVRREPALAGAWYGLAMTYQRSIVNQWSEAGASLRDMRAVCGQFMRVHPNDGGAHVAAAYVDVYSGDRAGAMARLRDSIELDPNSFAAYFLYGQTLAMESKPDDAIEQFELATRLSPRDPERWTVEAGVSLCHFVAERYAEMQRSAQRAVEMQPEIPFSHGTLAVAHAYLGDVEAARHAAARMLDLEPTTSLQRLTSIVQASHPELASRYIAGLRLAGVPS